MIVRLEVAPCYINQTHFAVDLKSMYEREDIKCFIEDSPNIGCLILFLEIEVKSAGVKWLGCDVLLLSEIFKIPFAT